MKPFEEWRAEFLRNAKAMRDEQWEWWFTQNVASKARTASEMAAKDAEAKAESAKRIEAARRAFMDQMMLDACAFGTAVFKSIKVWPYRKRVDPVKFFGNNKAESSRTDFFRWRQNRDFDDRAGPTQAGLDPAPSLSEILTSALIEKRLEAIEKAIKRIGRKKKYGPWTDWGGRQTIPTELGGNTMVKVRFRCGEKGTGIAAEFRWLNNRPDSCDIVCYRVRRRQ